MRRLQLSILLALAASVARAQPPRRDSTRTDSTRADRPRADSTRRPPQRLAPVVTNAQRPRPARDNSAAADVGAAESITIPQNAARRLAPDQAGDLSAIASSFPA